MSRFPIPSSAFGFDPFELTGPVRDFYERWHAQGGQSAREGCGIMRRAANYRDLRTNDERRQWEDLDWQLRRCAAEIRLKEIARQRSDDAEKKVVKIAHASKR